MHEREQPEIRLPAAFVRAGNFAASVLVLLVLSPFVAHPQEAIRMSLASAEAAAARLKAKRTPGYYNLELGRTFWNFGAALGANYESNVRLVADHPEDDYVFRPEINVEMFMPLSDKNALNISMGGGYSAYVMHSSLRRFYITPGTEASFDVYAGDVWVNLHDRISITENSYQDPTVAGDGSYSSLQNAVGLAATWDLNKLVLRSGYDHVNYMTLTGENAGGRPDGNSDLFSASAGVYVHSGLQLGVELSGAFLTYDNGSTNGSFSSASQWSVGAFCETQPTEYIHLHASAGYTRYSPESNPTLPDPGDFSGLYLQLDLNHRLNQYVDYLLSGGRSINYAFFGGTVDMYFARLSVNWKIFRKTSLSTSFDYEHGSQLGRAAEAFDRYGPAVQLRRGLTENLTGDFGVQYYSRDSNVAHRDYTALIVSSNLRYKF